MATSTHKDAYVDNGPKPVFIKTSDINGQIQGEELYLALSKHLKTECIHGIQRIGSLWRIYINQQNERVKLITSGLHLNNTTVPVYDVNPYTKSNDGLTRLTIKEIPLSVSDNMIKSELEKMKCTIRGEIVRQKLRVNGQLVNCLNGDRICYIDPPPKPLPRIISIANSFRGRIFHIGQPEQSSNCSKCLQTGHHASQCSNTVRCRICNQPGHKSFSCQGRVSKDADERKEKDSAAIDSQHSSKMPAAAERNNKEDRDVNIEVHTRVNKEARQTDIASFCTPNAKTSTSHHDDQTDAGIEGDVATADETSTDENDVEYDTSRSKSPTPKKSRKQEAKEKESRKRKRKKEKNKE